MRRAFSSMKSWDSRHMANNQMCKTSNKALPTKEFLLTWSLLILEQIPGGDDASCPNSCPEWGVTDSSSGRALTPLQPPGSRGICRVLCCSGGRIYRVPGSLSDKTSCVLRPLWAGAARCPGCWSWQAAEPVPGLCREAKGCAEGFLAGLLSALPGAAKLRLRACEVKKMRCDCSQIRY